MPTNLTGRVTLICIVVLTALWLIFPNPLKLLNPSIPFSEKHNLRPGIDMVGGTSLLYEIKPPEGVIVQNDLATQVMESLKRRVDPQGVRNLIWRPQGNTRLEIQMPLTTHKGDSKIKREAYGDAQRKVDELNVRVGQVTEAIEKLDAEARRERISQLAHGSKQREELFGALASLWDQIQKARQERRSADQADLEDQYDALKARIEAGNLTSAQLEAILMGGREQRTEAMEKIAKDNADFPERLAAVEHFRKAWLDFQDVKGSIDDASDLKRLLRGSGVLEFHILVTDLGSPEVVAMRERLLKSGPRSQAQDNMKWVQVDRPAEFQGSGAMEYHGKWYILVYNTPDKQLVNGPLVPKWSLESAFPEQDQTGRQVVGFRFDAQGGALFSSLTRTNINNRLGIVLDDKLISAPNINSEIGRQGIITGDFSRQELNYLINTLNAGSLPAQLASEPISERTVGPQLGADNLRAGLLSCFIGLGIVGLFMSAYYYRMGVVAFVAVVLNLVMILGVMAMLNATFTLPGVAGVVLTIGAAVDANVLIFERLREEQNRGLSLKMALRNAYDRAGSAIIDSNATTVITSLLLVWLGSEEVKGFGITLMIGLISSLFTALFVTKTIFAIMIEKFGVTKLGSFPLSVKRWDDFLKPNIDWMSKSIYFAGFSAILMITGGIALVDKWRDNALLDIEFASGTAVQFELKESVKQKELRALLDNPAHAKTLPSAQPVAVVGSGDKVWEVVTPNADSKAVQESIRKILGDRLNVELASTFEGVTQSADDAISAGAIVPIIAETTSVAGLSPARLPDFRGGAVMILKDLDPPLSAKEIDARISRARLQVQVGQQSAAPADIFVDTGMPEDKKATLAVVLVNNPDIPYAADELKWREDVVEPVWDTLAEAINRPPVLQKVSNFDAAVAGDTQKDAFMALFLSVVIIMAYIWLRFGNFVYGTATVVAMLHDTFLVIGAIGLAHWACDHTPGLASFLLLEPFRVNLTLVAAVLTVMSYSMIDTIVVFDRIRENRGKYGHLDRNVVNTSINQTLSRTLLTAGTTCVTIAVMYVTGGPGIHSFTFVLLFGILIGTYSSIAIGAPILLMFGKTGEETVKRPVGTLQRA